MFRGSAFAHSFKPCGLRAMSGGERSASVTRSNLKQRSAEYHHGGSRSSQRMLTASSVTRVSFIVARLSPAGGTGKTASTLWSVHGSKVVALSPRMGNPVVSGLQTTADPHMGLLKLLGTCEYVSIGDCKLGVV
jgi:hypothetical protein